eukprot:4702034-Prymnesium_polylepis.1
MPEAERHVNMHMNGMAEVGQPKRKKMRVRGGRAHWARDHDDDYATEPVVLELRSPAIAALWR